LRSVVAITEVPLRVVNALLVGLFDLTLGQDNASSNVVFLFFLLLCLLFFLLLLPPLQFLLARRCRIVLKAVELLEAACASALSWLNDLIAGISSGTALLRATR